MRRSPAAKQDAQTPIDDWAYTPEPETIQPPNHITYAHSLTRTPQGRDDRYTRLNQAIQRASNRRHRVYKELRWQDPLSWKDPLAKTAGSPKRPDLDPQAHARIQARINTLHELLDQGLTHNEIAQRLSIPTFMVMHYAAGRD